MFVSDFRSFKRVLSGFAFAAAVASATSLAGADRVWSGNGTDNKWSTAANWSGGAVPVSGDTVTIDIGDTPTVIDNDMAGLTLSKFTAVGTNNIVLTVTGEPIAIACGNNVNTIVWTNSCSLQLDAGMTITAGKGTVYFGGYSTIVNGDISVASGSELKFKGRTRAAKSLPGLINDDPIIKFYGDVGGEECSLYINFGANGNSTIAYFYGNVNCAKLILNSDTRPCTPHFCKAGNGIGAITFYGIAGYFDVDNVFSADTVIGPTNNVSGYVWPESGLRFKAGSYQIFNRLEGSPVHLNGMHYQNIFSSESSSYTNPSTDFCTFDLRGTQDAVSYMCLCDAINVIWNPTGDFTQDFRDRRHVTSGKINVMRGTLRSSGTNSFINVGRLSVAAGATLEIASTNVVTFPSLTLMSMESGARLRIAESASEAFASKTTILTMAEDAKIQVTAGATVRLGRLLVGGKEIDEGTYTSADWMEGSGSVTVEGEINSTNQTKHYWAVAIDGKWSSATNWTSGTVPGTTHSAIFELGGADYTATFDAASDTMPASVTLSGDGNTGTLAVTNELELKTQSIIVNDGGRLQLLSGSSLINTNTAIVSVYNGGEAEVTSDAQIVSRYNTYEKTHPVRLRGGKLTFRDNAVLTAPSSGGTRHIFSDGVTVFSGSSKLKNVSQDYFDVVPILFNGNAKLVFTDRAGLEGTKNIDSINIGISSSAYSGTSIVEFLSDCVHNNIYGARIGCPSGTGTMLVGAGFVQFRGRGIGVGSSNVGRYSSSTLSGGIGHITVTGGVLTVTSGEISEGQLTGLRFGDGSAIPDSIADNYTPWEGYYTQSGGNVTNSGNLCVGNQRSKGAFVQTGGTFCNSASRYPFFVGVRGGTGSAVFSGGTADIKGNVYVGGIFTNAIPHATDTAYPLAAYGWEKLAHYGTGTFTVSGGDVTLGKNLNLGYDGTGIVERVGSKGSFTVGGDLVMSNTAAYASASILRFALDSDGIAPIQIGGTATLTEGSGINVDLTAYTGKRATHTLLTAASVNGTFLDVDIVCGGKTAGYARIIVLSDKVILKIQKGTIVTFR